MHDAIIIGAGPAGLTSALYLLRSGKSVLLLEKEGIGGQIATSPRLENYPAIKTISGMEWADRAFDQVSELGVNFDFGEAKSIKKLQEGGFEVDYGSLAQAKTVIIAAGCHHKKLGIPNEDKLVGHGISYCATCDGPFYKGQNVLVIGDGNSAVQYAIELSNICNKVTVITLFDRFFADKVIVDRMLSLPNVEVIHNMESKEFIGEKELKAVSFLDRESGQTKVIEADGAFVAIGQKPELESFSNLIELENGYAVVDENMQTKTPGIYAVGDCREKKSRQVVTAISDGAIAAISARSYIDQYQS